MALVAALVLVAGGAGLGWLRLAGGPPDPVARRYLDAWQRGDDRAMAALVAAPPADFAARHRRLLAGLKATRATYTLGAVARHGDRADAAFTAKLRLRGLGEWDYTGVLRLVRRDRRWRVDWSPAAVHPALGSGQRLARVRTWPPRAAIRAADGSLLAGPGGVVRFARRAGQVTRPGGFAAHVLGQVGEATAEDLDRLGPPYQTGDLVGHGGLEQALERRLAGTPSGEVRVVDADGTVARVLQRFPGTQGSEVTVSLDPGVQQAAEAALGGGAKGLAKPAALVAVRPSTGAVLAVVSRPLGVPFDRALLGRYPPGSTFKVVTAAALLAGGLKPTDPVTCPATADVGGRLFQNFEGEQAAGPIPFSRAFAISCNTAFVQLAAARLDGGRLGQAAARLGFGADLSPGLPAVRGSFPPPADATALAAQAIGQGKVTASPLGMASVAAAVADGAWRHPHLVDGQPPTRPLPLDPRVDAALRAMLRAAVAGGTGTAANLPGLPVAGKTGTAEFGRGNPPPTHAWFIGFRGDLAFAIVVEGGGVGGRVAAPLAARFLAGL